MKKIIPLIFTLLLGFGAGRLVFGSTSNTLSKKSNLPVSFTENVKPIDLELARTTYEKLKAKGKQIITMQDLLAPQKETMDIIATQNALAAPLNIGNFVYVTCFLIGETGSWSEMGSGWINAGPRGDYFNASGGIYFNWSTQEDIICFDWGEVGEI